MKCGLIWSGYEYDKMLYDGDYFHNYMRLAYTNESYALNKFRLYYILKYCPAPKRILDYGAGCGAFIYFIKRYSKKIKVIGVDVYEHKAANIYHVDHFWEIDRGCKQYDIVTMWDVLEHTDSPWAVLLGLRSVLINDGLLVISTPNLAARKAEEITRWKHWKPQEHLYLFDETSLEKILTSCGYEIIDMDYTESAYRANNTSNICNNILTMAARPKYDRFTPVNDDLKYIQSYYTQITGDDFNALKKVGVGVS